MSASTTVAGARKRLASLENASLENASLLLVALLVALLDDRGLFFVTSLLALIVTVLAS